MLSDIEPTAWDPATEWTAATVQVNPVAVCPAGKEVVPPMVPASAVPWSWTEHAFATAFEVPVLVSVRVHFRPDTEHEVTWALTCAELVNDPKRPKTNPAIAIAAMRVIAMRMTVASTGEMAFLFFL